jgi:hypothetical protein
MTGGTQKHEHVSSANKELGVGEMEGAKFKVEPLRRTGEDANTMRARLLCPFLAPVPTLLPPSHFDHIFTIDRTTTLTILQIRAARGEP